MNDLTEYYTEQAGSGLAYFHGKKYQTGHGLGTFFKSSILPLLKQALPFLKRSAVSTGLDFAEKIKSGEDLGTAASKALKRGVGNLAEDALVTVKNRMSGSGLRRRRRRAPARRKTRASVGSKNLKRALLALARSKRKTTVRRRAAKRPAKRSRKAQDHLFPL